MFEGEVHGRRLGRGVALAVTVAVLFIIPARGGAEAHASRAVSSEPADLAEAMARRYLASRPELLVGSAMSDLRVARVLVFDSGALVRFTQTSRGLPVLGTAISVRLDGHGAPVYAASSLLAMPRGVGVTATVDVHDAEHRVRDALDLHDRAASARLAFASVVGRARLVYEVHVARRGLDTGFVALVCATTGRLLQVRETSIALDAGLVFLENPSVTPELVSVALPVTPLATTLEGAVSTASCVDTGVCTPLAWLGESAYVCRDASLAVRDGDGDFAYARPAEDTDPTDAFAEVQAFFHVGVMLDAFRSIAGDSTLTLMEQTRVSTNILAPEWLPDNLCGDATTPPLGAELAPLDNAYFAPADALTGEPRTLGFGQGTSADFAYDGDVVNHEVAHAMQAEVGEIGAYYLPDEYGLRGDQGALSEGNADFWSSVVTGDPEVGEYVGASVGSTLASGALRSLANDARCPEDFVGEGHDDGRVWGGVLWDIREGAEPANRPMLEQGLFAAMATTTEASTLRSIAATIEDELGFRFGDAERARVHALFEARGIASSACDGRIVSLGLPTVRSLVFLPPSSYVGTGPAPASVQFAITLTDDVKRIEASIGRVALGAERLYGANVNASMLVKCGGEPIVWHHEEGNEHDADLSVPIIVSGDVTSATASGLAVATGRFARGVCHVQFVNEHPQMLILVRTRIGTDAVFASPDGGCGCRVHSGRDRPGGHVFALVVFACLIRRRVRAGRRRYSITARIA